MLKIKYVEFGLFYNFYIGKRLMTLPINTFSVKLSLYSQFNKTNVVFISIEQFLHI